MKRYEFKEILLINWGCCGSGVVQIIYLLKDGWLDPTSTRQSILVHDAEPQIAPVYHTVNVK